MTDARRPEPGRGVDPRLFRFLLRHGASGIAAAWAALLGLLWSDALGLRSLLHAAEDGWLGLTLIAVGFALTGGAVGMGIAAMSLGDRREP
jgi:hypothetical protein